ncbi:POU domain, class 5, transcription factor 1-like [Hyperolius riggenbachi]|uniref:POU domain, class 5, transcription factor 1-like n=1 Tax=Hyperolius riggenbachi TaxID=752182 RepID=UPI0035A272DB
MDVPEPGQCNPQFFNWNQNTVEQNHSFFIPYAGSPLPNTNFTNTHSLIQMFNGNQYMPSQLMEMKFPVPDHFKVKQEAEECNAVPEPVPGQAWPTNYWPGNSGIAVNYPEMNPAVPSCSSTYPTPAGIQGPQNAAKVTKVKKAPRKRNRTRSSTSVKSRGGTPPKNTTVTLPSAVASTEQAGQQEKEQNEISSKELEDFAKQIKQKRVSLGLTQHDAGCSLGILYKHVFSQTTICRFESMQLSSKNMRDLMPILTQWLTDVDNNVDKVSERNNQEQALAQSRRRRRRTNIEETTKDLMEQHYIVKPKPDTNELKMLSKELHLSVEVVRVWFCNRRQKDKKEFRRRFSGGACEAQSPDYPHMAFPVPQEMPAQAYSQPTAAAVPANFPHRHTQRGSSPIVNQGDDAYSQALPHGSPIVHQGEDVYPQALPHGSSFVHQGDDVYSQAVYHGGAVVYQSGVYPQPVVHQGGLYSHTVPHGNAFVHRGVVYPQTVPHGRPIGDQE